MSNKTVVLAIFPQEASADTAAEVLKESGIAKKDAIGVLVLDEKGKLKADKVGKRSWGKGAGIGAVVALVTPVGLAAGLIGGGLLGALHHKNLGLAEEDRERLREELEGGKAAVAVLAPVSEATVVADKLTELGGTTQTHLVSDEAVEAAQTTAASELHILEQWHGTGLESPVTAARANSEKCRCWNATPSAASDKVTDHPFTMTSQPSYLETTSRMVYYSLDPPKGRSERLVLVRRSGPDPGGLAVDPARALLGSDRPHGLEDGCRHGIRARRRPRPELCPACSVTAAGGPFGESPALVLMRRCHMMGVVVVRKTS